MARRIGVVGVAGRMGRMLVQEIARTEGATLAGGTARAGSAAIGADPATLAGLPASGLVVGDDPAALFAVADAIIDFTLPGATALHARLAGETGRALVIGTTGLGPGEEAAIAAAAARAPVVFAPNMSLGVTVLIGLVEEAARRLDAAYDIEIVEMHHRHKIDAPSGTAIGLGEAAARGRAIDLATHAIRGRDGHTGQRPAGAIGFAALRGGDVVGDHTVVLAAPGERLELTHKASSREIYARGAVRAALWAIDRAPGRYGMKDVLAL